MSLSRLVEAPCANCNSLLDALVWQSINVSSDPFLKTLFLHEKINVAECENCHSICQLHLPFFYHDLDRDFLVVSMPEDMDREAKNREVLSIKARLTNFGDDAYRAGVHFVDGFGELRSKIHELEGPPTQDLSLLSWLSSPYQWFGGLVPPGWEPAAFAAPVFKSGAPVVLKYELSNLSSAPQQVSSCQRIHAAEMVPGFGEIALELFHEGERMQSQSWLEYVRPTPGDLAELSPGASVSGEIDLAVLFPITEPGLYRVRATYRVDEGFNDLDGALAPRRVKSVDRHFVIGASKSAGFLSMFRRKKTAAHVSTGAKLLAAWWDGGMKTLETPDLKQDAVAKQLYETSLKLAENERKKSGTAHTAPIAKEALQALLADANGGDKVLLEKLLASFDAPAELPRSEQPTPTPVAPSAEVDVEVIVEADEAEEVPDLSLEETDDATEEVEADAPHAEAGAPDTEEEAQKAAADSEG